MDALLTDEVVEATRPKRNLDVLLVRREHDGGRHRVHAACLTGESNAFFGRQLRIDCRQRLVGLEQRVAELDQRVALDGELPTRPIGTSPGVVFPFSSSTIRSAVFLPIPGIAWKRATSSCAIARRSSVAVEPDTIASATFGPTPFTVRSWVKSSRSAASTKP